MADDIRVLDLFAGAGGLTAGFHNASARFVSVAAVEKDLAAAASYEATFGDDIVFAGGIDEWLDTAKMPEDVDVLVGGPPCQGFSTLGKRQEEDHRNELWRSYARTILAVKPKYFVVENVAVFEKSRQFQDFHKATEPGEFLENYRFQHRVLNSADFGAAQSRKRAVLIGHRRDLPFPGLPEPTHNSEGTGGLQRHEWVKDVFARIPGDPDRDDVFDTKSMIFAGKTFAGAFTRGSFIGAATTRRSLCSVSRTFLRAATDSTSMSLDCRSAGRSTRQAQAMSWAVCTSTALR